MRCNGTALRSIRVRAGLSVTELAREVGISQPHLTNIERGDRQPSPEVLVKLAEALKAALERQASEISALVAVLSDPDPQPVTPSRAPAGRNN